MAKPAKRYNVNDYQQYVKFCPECGKELVYHPITDSMACFLHGDFIIVKEDLVWDYTNHTR